MTALATACTVDPGKGVQDVIDQSSCEIVGSCDAGNPNELFIAITTGTALGTIKFAELPAGETALTLEGICRIPGFKRSIIEWAFFDAAQRVKFVRSSNGCNSDNAFSILVDLRDVNISPKFFTVSLTLIGLDAFDNETRGTKSAQLQLRALGTSGPVGPTPVPTARPDRLGPDQFLSPGEWIVSPDGRNRLTYRADGNLVFTVDGNQAWESATAGTAAGAAVMQSDGNFVVYDPTGAPLFSSDTFGGETIRAQNDNNVVVYSQRDAVLWANGARFERGTKYPGLARDIAVGSTGNVWIIGAGDNGGGNSTIFRWNGSAWADMGGTGVKIAVQGADTAWVTNAAGQIFRYSGNNSWQQISGLAMDVAASSSSYVWILGFDNAPYIWVNGSWLKYNNMQAQAIAVGANGVPFVAQSSGAIFTLSSGNWVARPGLAKDLSINGANYVHIGFDSVFGTADYGAFKWDGANWQVHPTAGVSIAVDPNGRTWVVKSNGEIYLHN